MTATSRRSFLKGLFAAAAATQLPHIPAAQADPIVVKAADAFANITLNGKPPTSVGIAEAENGWYRVWGFFEDAGKKSETSFDFTGGGVQAGMELKRDGGVRRFNFTLAEEDGAPVVCSLYIKPDENIEWGTTQIERGHARTPYIATTR